MGEGERAEECWPREECGTWIQVLNQILNHVVGMRGSDLGAQICTINFAGADPRSPIGLTWAYPRVKCQTSLSLAVSSSHLLLCTGYSAGQQETIGS